VDDDVDAVDAATTRIAVPQVALNKRETIAARTAETIQVAALYRRIIERVQAVQDSDMEALC